MKKAITYIPTLKDLASARKKQKALEKIFLNPQSCFCAECSHYRSKLNVCIYADIVREKKDLKICPKNNSPIQM